MKISRKMYNKETKDCEFFIQFNDKEFDLIKNKRFIQEEYICATSIPAIYNAKISCGIVKAGIRHNDNKIIPFEYEYSKWSYDINNFEYNIIYCENKKFVYGDISLETIQKKFIGI